MTKGQKIFSALGRFAKEIFTKNIGLKITALLFAVLLWGYVLAVENPKYVKRVRDVEITFTGEDSLNSRGLMVVSRDSKLTDVDIECEISKHSDLDASRVSCTVDLSDREITLDQDEDSKTITRQVQTKVATGYGSVQAVSVNSVELTIARISSRTNIQVTAEAINSLADGFTYELPTGLTVSLRGQKSKLDQIAFGKVTVDLSSFAVRDPGSLAGTYDLVLPVQFYNSEKIPLDDIVTSTGETVTSNVRVTVKAYKDVPIEPDVVASGQFKESYEYECISAQEMIRIYGNYNTLLEIESIRTESVFPKMQTGEERLTVGLILPNGVSVDDTQSRMITLLMSVTERMAEGVYYQIPIEYSETKRDIALTGDEPKTIRVHVVGSVIAMKSFDLKWIRLTVNLQNYGVGTYDLPIVLTFTGDSAVYKVEPTAETVTVELRSTAPEPVEE